MTKRIPSQSAFKGISTKQWVRFVNALSEEEAAFLVNNACLHCITDYSPLDCSCCDVHSSLIDKVWLYLPGRRPSDYTPPNKLLVGVELNPGPGTGNRRQRRNRKVVTEVIVRPPARSPSQIAVVQRPTNTAQRRRALTSPPQNFLRTYVNALEDPWEFGPTSLGYGTLVETAKGVAYLRSSFVVNADGSFGIGLLPQVSNMVITNNAGAGVGTWVNNSASNNTALGLQMTGSRICSGGLRVFTLFPESSASGVLFAGSIPGYSISTFSTNGATSLAALSTSELGIGRRGARSVMLPIDMTAFNMVTTVVQTTNSLSALLPWTIPYICGTGFPTGTVVWYEAVLNIEGLPQVSTASVGIDADRLTNSASDYYVTPERLMRAASGLLTSTTVMDAVQGLASLASPTLGRTISSARSIFGSGRNYQNALVSGRNSRRNGHQNTIMIEEMKEDASEQRSSRGWTSL